MPIQVPENDDLVACAFLWIYKSEVTLLSDLEFDDIV
jgi:hypothetical protein